MVDDHNRAHGGQHRHDHMPARKVTESSAQRVYRNRVVSRFLPIKVNLYRDEVLEADEDSKESSGVDSFKDEKVGEMRGNDHAQ